MNSTFSHIDKAEFSKLEKLDSTNLDWSEVSYGPQTSVVLWRIFIWALTIIAIFGIATVLFWWQVNKGAGLSSNLSGNQIVQTISSQEINIVQHIDNIESESLSDFPEPETTGQYIVLAGSFVNEQNAKRIFNQLLQAGIPARSKQAMINGQHHTHLLVGPYGAKNKAKLAVDIIREKTNLPVDYISLGGDDDFDGQKLVLFDGSAKKSDLHPDQFIVLAGSFTDQDIALRVQNRLLTQNIFATVKQANDQDRTFFHVMVGPYRLAMQANNMVETIRQKTGILAESSQIL
ncbi:MAG: SPOR domain-containing protein [Magnetococcales bacterium]|nr:SPOR domain-containing protein [Magnetococcales bacterium]